MVEDPEVPWLGLRPRPSSNFSGQGSSLSKSSGRQSSSRSSRDSSSGSRSLQNNRTSVRSAVVQPKQDNGQRVLPRTQKIQRQPECKPIKHAGSSRADLPRQPRSRGT